MSTVKTVQVTVVNRTGMALKRIWIDAAWASDPEYDSNIPPDTTITLSVPYGKRVRGINYRENRRGALDKNIKLKVSPFYPKVNGITIYLGGRGMGRENMVVIPF